MRVSDAIFGALLLLFGGAIVLYARTFPDVPGHVYGPAAFPILIGAALALCGVLLVGRTVLAGRPVLKVELADWARSPRLVGNVVIVLSAIVGYILYSERLGFHLLAVVVLFGFFAWLRVRLWWCGAVAVGFTLVIHYLFVGLLRVPLPRGVLHPILPW